MVCGVRWLLWNVSVGLLLHSGLPSPVTQPSLLPCVANTLCSCRATQLSCTAIPLHRLPEWSSFELQHMDVSMTSLEILTESALDGLRLQTLVLVANKLSFIEPKALSSMAPTLASLDLGYNEFTEVPQLALRDLKVLNWLNLQNNYIQDVGPEIEWHHLEESLTSLSLSNNQISVLRGRALHALHRLVQLDLDGNRLRSLAYDALPSSLAVLKLSDNLLHHPPCDLLPHLPRLQALHLRHNFLTGDRTDACRFNATRKIEKLDLSNNEFDDTAARDFFRRVHVKQFILDLNELTAVPAFVYEDNRVEKLSISFNRLSAVSEDVFAALKHSLERLELEHNELTRLPASLAHAARLRHLSLAYNVLTEWPPLPPHLQSLSLAGNFLTSLTTALRALEPDSLRYLDLSYNRIMHLLPNQFDEWSGALSTVNLRGNRIAQISESVFPDTMPVKEIILSFNDLYYLHPNAFSNVSNSLQVLEFSSTLFSGGFPMSTIGALENLAWVTFDNNNIHIVSSSDIKMFPSLEYLNLDYNKIIDIPVDEDGLNVTSGLKDLRLAYNFISKFPRKLFVKMPELRNVDLSYNRIRNVSIQSLTNLPNLVYLSLAGNLIDFVESDAFLDLTKLEILELQENNLEEFSSNSLRNVSSSDLTLTVNISRNFISNLEGSSSVPINILDCSHNLLTQVPKTFLSALEGSLRQLIMSHNKVSHLDSQAFGGLVYLEILNLHKNNIILIKRRAFNELASLQILDLSYNAIGQLAVEQFYNMKKLRFLKMNQNTIRSLPRDIFKNTILEHVDLSFNHISIFPGTALSQIGFTLRYLDISHNNIEYLDSNMFQSTPFLLDLNLGGNALTVLSDNTFSSLGGLRKLDLSFNSIKANFKELFHNLPNLKHLNLANVGLKSVPYLPLANLTSLNLSSNFISGYRDGDVKRLQNLRELYLSYNRLTSVVPKMWIFFRNLNSLDISYNPIARIMIGSFKGLDNLSYLNINGLRFLEVIENNAFRPLISLRSLHVQSWSQVNHDRFRLCNITSSVSSLHKLVVHFTDDVITNQLHELATKKLRHLEIRGPNLKEISGDAFRGFENQHELYLKITETSLRELPNGFMEHLGNIPHLGIDLSNNKLTTLSPAVFYPNITSWNHVATKLLSGGLVLSGNPLKCECELAWLGGWLRRWLQESAGASAGSGPLRLAVRAATCRDNGKHIPLLQLHTDEADCHASALSSDAVSLHIDLLLILIWTFILSAVVS